ncbi:hypothetical protein [Paractinoplanes lichenicola]|uniref:Leucine rich repeat variant n=1 Tax=Paractinoplanes lichenicola TaxID=2802976 RepID=A0ABS1VQ72_9ACTN|nr:hypothetical protein [Actinoplanes lichenicola]MBL7255912.1 hypothetical protein [Actinoplanes lichenicola]
MRTAVVPYARVEVVRALRADSDPRVAAAATAWIAELERPREPADLPPQHCHAFWRVLKQPLSRALAAQVAASDDVEAIQSIAVNPTLPPDIAEALSRHPDAGVRAALAGHAEQFAVFVTDPDPEVRAVVAIRAGLTAEQIAVLAVDPDAVLADHPDFRVRALVALDPEADPALIARLSADPDPWVRKAMARCPRLPAGRLAALLDDPELATDSAANPSLGWEAVVDGLSRGAGPASAAGRRTG